MLRGRPASQRRPKQPMCQAETAYGRPTARPQQSLCHLDVASLGLSPDGTESRSSRVLVVEVVTALIIVMIIIIIIIVVVVVVIVIQGVGAIVVIIVLIVIEAI